MMLIDGVEADRISAADRGLHYADGLFETLRIHRGEAPLLRRHLARLAAGCRHLDLPHPGDAVLSAEVAAMCRTAPGDAVVKIILTRGAGGRGYAPPAGSAGRRIVSSYPWSAPAGPPLALGVCLTRIGHSPALASLKHLGRLEQVLAASEVAAAGWDEGLMLDPYDQVIEATRHNLFFVRDGGTWTPPLAGAGVAGIMRALVLESLVALGLPGGEAPLRYDELHEVEAMFLCNAVVGVRPVARVGQRVLGAAPVLAALRGPLLEAGVTWLD